MSYPSISQEQLDIPENKAAIAYLEIRKKRPGMTHPDIADRLQTLGKHLAHGKIYLYGPSTILVAGKPSLIVGIGIGTAHVLKTGDSFQDAILTGARTVQIWTDEKTLDITEAIGSDWIFDGWRSEEPGWIQSSIDPFKSAE